MYPVDAQKTVVLSVTSLSPVAFAAAELENDDFPVTIMPEQGGIHAGAFDGRMAEHGLAAIVQQQDMVHFQVAPWFSVYMGYLELLSRRYAELLPANIHDCVFR